MATLEVGPGEALHYVHEAPAGGRPTCAFINALTGDVAMWEAEIAPALRAAGLGTLVYNLRGQADSPAAPDRRLDVDLVVGDLVRLLDHVAPPRPILVGLSIGGLFGARAVLAGAAAEGLVLINTLRRIGPRLAWFGDAMMKIVDIGGLELMGDLMTPFIIGEERLAAMAPARDDVAAYTPLDKTSGAYRLLADSQDADWDLPYEELALPVLCLSGLQDRVFYDAADVAALSARLPDGRRIDVPGAGHMLPVECPATVVEALLAFAGGLDDG
jgi:pimeloyl-ACP methyl ester carboxylesterase